MPIDRDYVRTFESHYFAILFSLLERDIQGLYPGIIYEFADLYHILSDKGGPCAVYFGFKVFIIPA